MRFASVFVLFLFFAAALPAQSYKTAAGIRIDNGINLTLQQHVLDKWTVEGIVHTSLRSDDVGFTVLAEHHRKILFRGLNFYLGAGPHYYWQNGSAREDDAVTENVYGLSVIGGAEISLGRINLAVDLKPELHFNGDEDVNAFEWNGAALSVRYIFLKRERNKISDWKIFGGGKKKKKKGSSWW